MDQATQPTHDNQPAKSLPEHPLIELPIPPSQPFNNRDDLATYLDSFALQHGYSISCGRSHPGTLTFWCRRSGFPAHTNKTDRPVKSVKIGCPFEIIATKTGDDKDSNSWFFAPSCTKHNHQPDPDIKPRNRKTPASKDIKPKKTSNTKESKVEINPADLISTQDLQISTASQPPISTTTATTHSAPSNVIPRVNPSVPLALNKISERLQIICSTINQLSSHSQLEILDTFEQILVSRHPSTHSRLFLLPPHLPTTVSNIPDASKSPNQPLSFHDILQSIHNPSMSMEPDDTNTNNVKHNTSNVVLQSDLPPRDRITVDQPLPTLATAEHLITRPLPELPKSMLTPSPNCHQSNDSNGSSNHHLHSNESTHWDNDSNFSHPDIDKNLSAHSNINSNLSAHCNIDLKWSGPPNLDSNLSTHHDLDRLSSSHHDLDRLSSSGPNLDRPSSSHPDLDSKLSTHHDLHSNMTGDCDLLPDINSNTAPQEDKLQRSQAEGPVPVIQNNITNTKQIHNLESTQQLQVVQKPAQVTRITRKRLREMQSASISRPQTRSKARQPPITKP
ncbi:hypothetical protein DFH28DRAFT_1131898 [Melampsora americana]|nr:hypothetical protein DFH28DRAFT_1131898 [Melampsora americana]